MVVILPRFSIPVMLPISVPNAAKASCPRISRFGRSITIGRDKQPKKAYLPIFVSDGGKFTFVSEEYS